MNMPIRNINSKGISKVLTIDCVDQLGKYFENGFDCRYIFLVIITNINSVSNLKR